MYKNEDINIKNLLTLLISDIDIFLLKEDDQETDKDKVYTKEEIREQLENSLIKFLELFNTSIQPIDKISLFPALSIYALLNNPIISKREKIKILKEKKLINDDLEDN